MMAAGDSAGKTATALRTAGARTRARADRIDRVAEAWERGAEGERLVGDALDALDPSTYVILEDRRLPSSDANIDHIVVGPSGVFVIDAKAWSGSVIVDGQTLRQNGRRRDDHIEKVRVYAVVLSRMLEDALGPRQVVRPVLCFVGEARLGQRSAFERVHLTDLDDIVELIHVCPEVLTPADVRRAAEILSMTLSPRVPESAVKPTVTASEPADPVLFLEPWDKAGRHRLYVKDASGADLGYIDRATGEVHPATASTAPLLDRLLPVFAGDGRPGDPAESMSSDALGALRRRLAAWRRPRGASKPSPLICANHWRRGRKNRLYVDRLDAGGVKVALGWFDLDEERYTCEQPDVESTLLYCGERYRAHRET